MKIPIIFVMIMCLILPVAAGTIHWTNQDGETITSAYTGDVVRFSFDTVNNGTSVGDTRFYFNLLHTNTQTGAWIYDSAPGFNLQAFGGNSSTVIPDSTSVLFVDTEWVGWGNVTVSDYDQYKIILYGYNATRSPVLIDRCNSTLSVSNNPLQFGGLGQFVKDIGGDGLRYAIAIFIIVVMMVLPYVFMKRFNLYIEILMIIFGLGISYASGLLDTWVMFALGVGSLAIFILVSKSQGGNQ